MIDLNPEIVANIVDLAHRFQYSEPMIPRNDSLGLNTDGARDLLSFQAQDPTYEEFTSLVQDLEPDQQVTLIALMWLGRGDFEIDDWDSALEAAGDAWNERTARYIMETPLAADYLAEGLSLHGY